MKDLDDTDMSDAELEIDHDSLSDLEFGSSNDDVTDLISHNFDAETTYYNYTICIPETVIITYFRKFQ